MVSRPKGDTSSGGFAFNKSFTNQYKDAEFKYFLGFYYDDANADFRCPPMARNNCRGQLLRATTCHLLRISSRTD